MVSASPSPRLRRHRTSSREDSCIEPRAYHAALWPFRGPASIASSLSPSNSSRRLPRPLAAPIMNLRSSAVFALEHSFEFSELHEQPVPLSSGLSPTLRDVLPHPTPLRAPSPPVPSDLSAASTRAVTEPHTLRDLRRVTAPLSMMDPWQYDTLAAHCHDPNPSNKGTAASASDNHPHLRRIRRISHSSESRRRKFRPKFFERKLNRRMRHEFPQRCPIPDRLQDAFVGSSAENSQSHFPIDRRSTNVAASQPPIPVTYRPFQDDSILTAVTGEESEQFDQPLSRPRAASEPSVRRRQSSFFAGREGVLSIWDRLWRRRRSTQYTSSATAHSTTSSPARRSGKLSRLRRFDFRLTSRSYL
eukprot:TRINITY_DN313_c0_g1_i4.p1 TRINITY_DN313_c0_g1~~TRINITY_DN313_c0_g1_i4.p1  ORF type:complete len:360 (+),score=40.63 TRINITY_DN313_c0_g1_i4:1961-3040(+)